MKEHQEHKGSPFTIKVFALPPKWGDRRPGLRTQMRHLRGGKNQSR